MDELIKKYLNYFTLITILKKGKEKEKKIGTIPMLTKVTKG